MGEGELPSTWKSCRVTNAVMVRSATAIKGMNLTVWNSCLVLAMASPGEMLCLWSSISRCQRENALVGRSCTGKLLLNLLEKQAVCSARIG